jgi:hypothetical protein
MKQIDDALFDELLTAALYRASELDNTTMPSDDELNNIIEPTAKFQHKMNKLINNPYKYVRNKQRTPLYNIMRGAAAFFIAFTLLFGTTMAVSPTVRAVVIDFVRSWLTDRTEYWVPEKDVDNEWTFGYIPDGFKLIAEQINEAVIMQIYQRDEDLMYLTITISSGRQIIDNEHSDYYQTIINGRIADIYESNNPLYPSIIVMYEIVTNKLITLTSDLNLSELIKIAENIE